MVEQQLRSLGLRIRRPVAPPPPDVRQPRGRPPAARPGWEGFLVAQKPAGDPSWPPTRKTAIAEARANYEAGTHEMFSCTTPEGWTQLYCRPRKTPTAPRGYFTRGS